MTDITKNAVFLVTGNVAYPAAARSRLDALGAGHMMQPDADGMYRVSFAPPTGGPRVFPAPSQESLLELDKRLRAEMTDEARANYERCRELAKQTRVIEATNTATGKRGRFEFAEHYNIGPGWQMRDLEDGRGIVSSFDLTDMEPVISPETAPRGHTSSVQVFQTNLGPRTGRSSI